MRAPRTTAVGEHPEPRTIGPITQTDIVRFAGAGGAFNPLHHDPARAAAAGFDRPIAMGQFTAGLLAAWLTDTFGVEYLRSLEVRFTAPLFIGDVVELSGHVLEIATPEGAPALATIELAATRSGEPVVKGRATVVITTA